MLPGQLHMYRSAGRGTNWHLHMQTRADVDRCALTLCPLHLPDKHPLATTKGTSRPWCLPYPCCTYSQQVRCPRFAATLQSSSWTHQRLGLDLGACCQLLLQGLSGLVALANGPTGLLQLGHQLAPLLRDCLQLLLRRPAPQQQSACDRQESCTCWARSCETAPRSCLDVLGGFGRPELTRDVAASSSCIDMPHAIKVQTRALNPK